MPWHPISDFPAPWFHGLSRVRHEVGDVIEPGSMGRIIRTLYPADDSRPRTEAIYDEARLAIDPQLPSRLDCTFVCPTALDRAAFAMADLPVYEQWYEVEPVESVERVFVTTLNYWAGAGVAEARARVAAEIYWREPAVLMRRELLYPGPLRVVGMVDDPVAMVDRINAQGELAAMRLGSLMAGGLMAVERVIAAAVARECPEPATNSTTSTA